MVKAIFNPANWSSVPFHFWSVAFFVLGSIVGSFLNVCIHRMPYGLSIVSPPSHCPHCKYSIPWYLNIPLVTWVWLGGKCRNCGAPISVRYFLVELLTATTFLGCWLAFGHHPGAYPSDGRGGVAVTLVYAVFLSGLIVATFIDFEHYIIPDEITIGGALAGFLCSFFLPQLQGETSPMAAMKQSFLGAAAGAGTIYFILRMGKLAFGREKLKLPAGTKIIFGESALLLPDREVLYADLLYRESDVIAFHAHTVEMADRCYKEVLVRLSRKRLQVGGEEFHPEEVPYMEATSAELVLPREAMGLGDVKFMAAIGAFLGWQAVIFSLVVSSLMGALVGMALIVTRKRALGSRLPYGPYIALAAAVWVFAGRDLLAWYTKLIASWMGH
jgi:leader peptidase (prepilin peptidase)/N-methyltransferase